MPYPGREEKRMKKTLMALAALALVLSGCQQTETKITVDSAGAGTIERTLVLRSDVVEMMKGMQAFDSSRKDASIFDENKLRTEASSLGEGVRFVSAAPVRTGSGEGYRAVYSFRDISRLRVNQTPGSAVSEAGMDPSGTAEEYLTFSFTRGNPARLVIHLYQSAADGPGAEPRGGQGGPVEDEDDDADDEEAALGAETLRQFYGDMKLLLTLEAGRTIVESDADYRSGNTVTLMDLDFEALSGNPEAFDLLARNKIGTLEEMKEFSRKYPGIRLESKKEVTIRFR